MTSEDSQTTCEVSELWKNAKAISAALTGIPASFSSAIRLLVNDDLKNEGVLGVVTKYQVARLFNTPSFKSLLYYAAREFRDQEFEGKKSLSIGQMMSFFRPLDLAAIISLFVYYRKSRRLLNDENWKWIEEPFVKTMLIGGQLGTAIPKIGTGVGLLLGAIRYYALSAMVQKAQEGFKQYRRDLKKKNLKYDLELEQQLFGCSSIEVGVFLLSSVGFGVDVGNSFARAFDPTATLVHATDELPYRMKIGKVWIDALEAGLHQPACPIPGHYYPLAEDFQRLESRLKQISSDDLHFLMRSKDDIGPESTPLLFVKSSVKSEVPEELEHVFTAEEIEGMKDEDLDALMDHMDAEYDAKGKTENSNTLSKDIEDLEEKI